MSNLLVVSLGPITSASLRETHGAPPKITMFQFEREEFNTKPTFFASVMGESLFTGQLVVAIWVLRIYL